VKTAFVIFTGYNQRATIAFIRVLEQHGVDYFLVATGPGDTIFLTRYASRVAFIRENPALDEEHLYPALGCVAARAQGKELVFAPSTEALNRFFLGHRLHLEKLGIRVPLVGESLYKTISDKSAFSDLCQSSHIRVPAPIRNPGDCPLPFAAKPSAYDPAKGLAPVLVFSEQDRENLLAHPDLNQFYFQEFVEGRSLYLLLHLSRSGETTKFSQENLLQQPNGKSIIAAMASDFHLHPESECYISMLRNSGFFGLVMVEVRQRGEDYFMIEANPRFWGPSQLFVDAMPVNLFEAFLTDNGIPIEEPSPGKNGSRYFWHQGLTETLQAGLKPVFHNYSPNDLALDFPDWIRSDIYRRPDTIDLFTRAAFGGP
jgi:hypothetical protein